MKKILALICSLVLIVSLAACGTSQTTVDYKNEVDFETALNNGEDVTNKTVTLTVDKIVPDSAFGFNIQSGEHLNFCSTKTPDVEVGNSITVKVTKVATMLGSYIINYDLINVNAKDNTDNLMKSMELLPLEVKEFGYSVDNEYLYYSIILHNPNADKAIELPSFRITARNDSNEVLATEDQTLSIIYPKQDFVYASLGFDVSELPAKVDIEVLEIDEYNVKETSLLDHPQYVPLSIENASYKEDSIVGEIKNNNDYSIDSSVVTVIFRDENNVLIGGTSTFVDSISANSNTPFDMSIYENFATENFEIYANIW